MTSGCFPASGSAFPVGATSLLCTATDANTDDLLVTINATGEVIAIDSHFHATTFGIDHIQFASGELWDRHQIEANAWFRGTSGNDVINGTSAVRRT